MARKENESAGTSLGHAWRGLVVFYLVAFALNAVSLHRNNEHMPYGPVRTFWVSASAPFASAASQMHLDGARNWMAGTWGKFLNKP